MVKKINILAVDDDKGIQKFISDILSEEGYVVKTASNGTDALEAFKKNSFDFVITDLYMHQMDGLDLLKEIKTLSPKTCVIIMTGFGSISTAVEAIKKGAYDYLIKPLDATSILVTVRNATNQINLENKNISLENELEKTRHLENVSLELGREIDNLFYLNSLTQAIGTFIDIDLLQHYVLDNCKKILDSQSASIFLVDEKNPDELILTTVSGAYDRKLLGTRQKLGDGIAGQVALQKKPLLVQDIDKELPSSRKSSSRYESKSFICVPLLTQNQLIGIINATNKKGQENFTSSDVNLLAILAGHAASAIANIRNYNLLKHLNQNLKDQIDQATRELIKKNEDLEILKQYNENIIKSLSLGLLVFDKNLLVTYTNYTMKNLLHFSPSENNRVKISDINLFRGETWKGVYTRVFTEQQPKHLNHYEYSDIHHNLYFLDIIISPMLDERGQLIGGILVANNVTDQVALEQKLAHSERLAVVGKLAAKVAHELNNPLDGILRFVNLTLSKIGRFGVNPEIIDYLSESRAGLIRMAQIISSLLEFSRGMQPASEKNNINETIRDAVKAMSPAAMSNNVKIITHLSDGLPKIIAGNIFQVLTNLIKNGIDAIGKNGTITLRTMLRNESIVIEIADTGKGIPDNIITQIFDPFFTTKSAGQGSGLGLSICLGIIEECHGKIDVKSTAGEGTTFVITLPTQKAKTQTLNPGDMPHDQKQNTYR